MAELAWQDLASALTADRRHKPRATGVTMVIDTGMGAAGLRDVLELAGPYIDHWKFAFGTSVLHGPPLLRRKLAMLAEHSILAYPGGTLLEVALVERHCREYMRLAKAEGFTAVEISDGVIPMPAFRRRNIIRCALDAGLTPITEAGKKDPRQQPSADSLATQILDDLEQGAQWVVVESRESGRAVGVFDEQGKVIGESVALMAERLGAATDRLLWEAPLQNQQTWLIQRFGVNVGLGNIHPDQILAVEALRRRLRYDTLHTVTEALLRSGAYDPAAIEPLTGADSGHDRPD